MTQGPLARVNTKVAAINLDISRKLNWGRVGDLEFITVNRLELGLWEVHKTLSKGFDRVSQAEKTQGDGSEVIIEVADLDSDLGPILRLKDLHLRVDGEIYRVSRIPPVASNEAQVFTLGCKIRTLKTNFDATK